MLLTGRTVFQGSPVSYPDILRSPLNCGAFVILFRLILTPVISLFTKKTRNSSIIALPVLSRRPRLLKPTAWNSDQADYHPPRHQRVAGADHRTGFMEYGKEDRCRLTAPIFSSLYYMPAFRCFTARRYCRHVAAQTVLPRSQTSGLRHMNDSRGKMDDLLQNSWDSIFVCSAPSRSVLSGRTLKRYRCHRPKLLSSDFQSQPGSH